METKHRWKLGVLSGSHFINDFQNGVLIQIVPLLYAVFHFSFAQVTTLIFLSSVAGYLIQPVLGYLADNRQKPWLLPVSTLFLGGGLFVMGFIHQFGFFVIAVIISGFGSALFHPDANRSVYLLSPEKRGLAQSTFQIGGNSGMAFAPISLLLLTHYGMHATKWFFFLSIISGCFLLALASKTSLKKATEKKRVMIEQKSKGIGVLVGVSALRTIANVGLLTFMPLFLIQKFGIQTSQVWIYNFLFLIGGAIGTFTGGPLADRYGHRLITQLSFFVSFPLALLIMVLHGTILLFILFVFGFILLSTFAVTVVYAQDLMPGKEGMASSLVVGLAGGLSGIVIQLLGIFADYQGLIRVMWIVILIPVAGALLCIWLPKDLQMHAIRQVNNS